MKVIRESKGLKYTVTKVAFSQKTSFREKVRQMFIVSMRKILGKSLKFLQWQMSPLHSGDVAVGLVVAFQQIFNT